MTFFLEAIAYHVYRLTCAEPSLPLCHEANLLMVDDLFGVFFNSVYRYFIDNF